MKWLDTRLLNKAHLAVSDTMFIRSSSNDMAAEITCNMWLIGISQEESTALTTQDVLIFLDKVLENRQQQLDKSNVDHGMIFYLWFDEQAVQLRFNLISDYHRHLPFHSQLNIVDKPDLIIDKFLRHPYHDGIPLGEVVEVADGESFLAADAAHQPSVVDVFQLTLLPSMWPIQASP